MQAPGGSSSSSGYDVLVGELVEQQNWLLCAVMTLCGQADVCTSTADNSDTIHSHISYLQAWLCLRLLLAICLCISNATEVIQCFDSVGRTSGTVLGM